MVENRVVFCCDDFGGSSGINDAVRELLKIKLLQRVALIAGGPSFDDALEIIREYKSLEVGLHFVLTDLNATSKSLICKGTLRFPTRRSLIKQYLTGKVRATDIESELESQLAILYSNGVVPRFINGHQHVHYLPFVFPIVRKIAIKHNLKIRSLRERIVWSRSSPKFLPKATMVNFLDWAYKLCWRDREIFLNTVLVHNFRDRDFSLPAHIKRYQACRKLTDAYDTERFEYMVHPSVDTQAMAELWYVDQLHQRERVLEFEALSSPAFIDIVRVGREGGF